MMTPEPYGATMLEVAARLGAATLHESAGRIGALPSEIKPIARDFRLAGPAFTLDCAACDNLWIHRALYLAQPGDVLVVAPRPGREAGYWGDILNAAALARGLAGLVINGGVRDCSGLASASFPVFSRTVAIQGTGKDDGALAALRQPVRIGDVIIRDRDLIVGDADGVVAIPQAEAREAVKRGNEREQDERAKIAQIKAGARTIDLYGFGIDHRSN